MKHYITVTLNPTVAEVLLDHVHDLIMGFEDKPELPYWEATRDELTKKLESWGKKFPENNHTLSGGKANYGIK